MNLLALDSSTEACSAALWTDAGVIARFELAPRRHTQLLLPMAYELLAEASISLRQLDGIGFGQGPGSFTGIRITVGLIQGLAMGLDCPVHGISTLAALASRCMRLHAAEHVAVALDARMNQVYWGQYEKGSGDECLPQQQDQLRDPSAIPLLGSGTWQVAGAGWSRYKEALSSASGLSPEIAPVELYPHAEDIARLAAFQARQQPGIPATQIKPVYLRQQVAEKMRPKGA